MSGAAEHVPAFVDVLLDVDGVLSPPSPADPRTAHPTWWPDAVLTRAGGLPLWYSPTVVDRLNDLADVPGTRMFWLTSWEHNAPRWLAPAIGLRAQTWPVLGARGAGPDLHGWWKADAVAAHLATADGARSSRVVWVDDELDAWADDERPADQQGACDRLLAHPRLTLLSPETSTGLLPADLDRLEALVGLPPAPSGVLPVRYETPSRTPAVPDPAPSSIAVR